jgi:hypothetical protein
MSLMDLGRAKTFGSAELGPSRVRVAVFGIGYGLIAAISGRLHSRKAQRRSSLVWTAAVIFTGQRKQALRGLSLSDDVQEPQNDDKAQRHAQQPQDDRHIGFLSGFPRIQPPRGEDAPLENKFDAEKFSRLGKLANYFTSQKPVRHRVEPRGVTTGTSRKARG